MNTMRVLLVVWLAAGCAARAQTQVPPPPPATSATFKLSAEEQAVFEAVNAERKKANLPALVVNPTLQRVAREHSANQAKQQKMAYELSGKTPADRVKEAGYRYSRVAENVAMGQPTPAEVMKSWMNSSGHKANILGDYAELGVGLAKDAEGRLYWTQLFGTRLR
jgi:uncharacterized protein YkwD